MFVSEVFMRFQIHNVDSKQSTLLRAILGARLAIFKANLKLLYYVLELTQAGSDLISFLRNLCSFIKYLIVLSLSK